MRRASRCLQPNRKSVILKAPAAPPDSAPHFAQCTPTEFLPPLISKNLILIVISTTSPTKHVRQMSEQHSVTVLALAQKTVRWLSRKLVETWKMFEKFKQRSSQLEDIDTGNYTAEEYEDCISELQLVNRWMGD